MASFLGFMLRRHPIAAIALAGALAALGFFIWQFAVQAVHFANLDNRERDLEEWMSPRYVAISWDLPRPVIMDIMEMSPGGPRPSEPPTVGRVLERSGLTLAELQARVEAAAAGRDMRASRGANQ